MDPLLSRLQLEMATKEQRKMLPEYAELCSLVADQMFIYYTKLKKSGFTEGQALQIIIDHGIDAGRISWMGNDGGEDNGY